MKFLNQKTRRFYFEDGDGATRSYVLIFGDEIEPLPGPAARGPDYIRARYRRREGEMKAPPLTETRPLEMYFLDVGQGDAAYIVTPNGTRILVDGGLKMRALGFLAWKYRLDLDGPPIAIDHLIVSHGDADHVEGLIPLLNHPKITVRHIWHNGIAVFDDPSLGPLGAVENGRLTTRHDRLNELAGASLARTFGDWIDAAAASGADYRALDAAAGVLDVGDPAVRLDILGPRREADGSLRWFGDKSHTINGHSVVFRLTYKFARVLFSGDVNIDGARHLLAEPGAALAMDAHILKSPHHGSHEFEPDFLAAIRPQITVVSSGDSPDHGHPRASFLGAVGMASRGAEPLIFATEIAATFVDAGDEAASEEPVEFDDLDFSTSAANAAARRRFKKALSGIINVRTDGERIYCARRVRASYQWEAYGPIDPVR